MNLLSKKKQKYHNAPVTAAAVFLLVFFLLNIPSLLNGDTVSAGSPTDSIASTDTEAEITLLMHKLTEITDADSRHEVLLKLAILEELSGKLETARARYQAAAFAKRDTIDYKALLSSASIFFSMGEYENAYSQAAVVSRSSEDKKQKERALVISSRSLYMLDQHEEAWRIIEPELIRSEADSFETPPAPDLLHWGIQLTALLGHEKEKETLKEVLFVLYPESPESMLVRETAEYIPDLAQAMGLFQKKQVESVVLSEQLPENPPEILPGQIQITEQLPEITQPPEATPPSDPQPAFIQTGSFRDGENAEYQVRDLKNAGFNSKIQEAVVGDNRYYRVVVPLPDGIGLQEILLRLKEKGFEGYPLY